MLRSLAFFIAGAASVLLVVGFTLDPSQPGGVSVAERSTHRDVVGGSALEVEIVREEQAVGMPPSAATRVARGDSASARRQAFARTLRDLGRTPPLVAPSQPDAPEDDPETSTRALLDGMLAGFHHQVAPRSAGDPSQGERVR